MQGVTSGISSRGTLLWEAFSKLPTVWAAPLPSGDVCATGGYDALITCFQTSGVIDPIEPVAVISATPLTGNAPMTVTFDGSGSIGPNPFASWTNPTTDQSEVRVERCKGSGCMNFTGGNPARVSDGLLRHRAQRTHDIQLRRACPQCGRRFGLLQHRQRAHAQVNLRTPRERPGCAAAGLVGGGSVARMGQLASGAFGARLARHPNRDRRIGPCSVS